MAQHNFIVEYDTTINEWAWNTETEQAVMGGKTIYVPEVDEWVRPSHNNLLTNIDNELAESVGSAINYLNRKAK